MSGGTALGVAPKRGGSSGGGGTVDATARNSIAQIIHAVGASISDGGSTFQDGALWFNRSGSAVLVPDPATEANMRTAGFLKGEPDADFKKVSTNTTAQQAEHIIVSGNTEAVTITLAAGVTRAQVSRALDSGSAVTVVSADGHGVGGDVGGVELNGRGTAWFRLDGTNFIVVGASQDLLDAATGQIFTRLDAVEAVADDKQDPATTLAGYGITDAYRKDEADSNFLGTTGVQKIEGNLSLRRGSSSSFALIDPGNSSGTTAPYFRTQYNARQDEIRPVEDGLVVEIDRSDAANKKTFKFGEDGSFTIDGVSILNAKSSAGSIYATDPEYGAQANDRAEAAANRDKIQAAIDAAFASNKAFRVPAGQTLYYSGNNLVLKENAVVEIDGKLVYTGTDSYGLHVEGDNVSIFGDFDGDANKKILSWARTTNGTITLETTHGYANGQTVALNNLPRRIDNMNAIRVALAGQSGDAFTLLKRTDLRITAVAADGTITTNKEHGFTGGEGLVIDEMAGCLIAGVSVFNQKPLTVQSAPATATTFRALDENSNVIDLTGASAYVNIGHIYSGGFDMSGFPASPDDAYAISSKDARAGILAEQTRYLVIASIAATNPVRLTITDHGLPDGKEVTFSENFGIAALRESILGYAEISVIDANTIDLIGVDGTGFGAFDGAGRLIDVIPTRNLDLSGLKLSGWERQGIRMGWCEDFKADDLKVEGFGYHGILTVSSSGRVGSLAISGAGPGQNRLCYGISGTVNTLGGLLSSPGSRIDIDELIIEDNPYYVALDSHGSQFSVGRLVTRNTHIAANYEHASTDNAIRSPEMQIDNFDLTGVDKTYFDHGPAFLIDPSSGRTEVAENCVIGDGRIVQHGWTDDNGSQIVGAQSGAVDVKDTHNLSMGRILARDCSGKVINVQSNVHAFSLDSISGKDIISENGEQVLIHVNSADSSGRLGAIDLDGEGSALRLSNSSQVSVSSEVHLRNGAQMFHPLSANPLLGTYAISPKQIIEIDATGRTDTRTIAGITKTAGNPVNVETTVAHVRNTGELVYMRSITGADEVENVEFTITVVDALNFTLDGTEGISLTPYVSGGTVYTGIPFALNKRLFGEDFIESAHYNSPGIINFIPSALGVSTFRLALQASARGTGDEVARVFSESGGIYQIEVSDSTNGTRVDTSLLRLTVT